MLTALYTLVQDLGKIFTKLIVVALIVLAYTVAYFLSSSINAAGLSLATMLVAMIFFQVAIYPTPISDSNPAYNWFETGYRNVILFIVGMIFCYISIAVVAFGATKHLS
jgi:amino acid permease